VLDGFLRQKLLNLFVWDLEEFERRLDNAIEQEGEVHKQSKADNLKPFEGLPAQSQRDNPDEQGSAGVDSGSGGSTDTSSDRQPKEIETTVERISTQPLLSIQAKLTQY
jgi:hypothetical protein